jgi:hypothetical protein
MSFHAISGTRVVLIFMVLLLLTAPLSAQIINTYAGTGVFGFSGDGGPATAADLYGPCDVEFDAAGNLYIADFLNSVVRKVDVTTGIITTIAGQGGVVGYSGDGGPATLATLWYPDYLVLSPAGDIYIQDQDNYVLRKVTAATGIITTVAGGGTGCAGETDDVGDGCPATSASENGDGLALDSAGNLYFGDTGDSRVRKIDMATGIITSIAGTGTAGYTGDGGPATSAELYYPIAVWFDAAGDLYIADYGASVVRKVAAATGIITTAVGNGTAGYSGDGGPATQAELDAPGGVKFDNIGNLLIADTSNNAIREVSAATGIITTVAGSGSGCSAETDSVGDGCPATSAILSAPYEMACDSKGNLFIGDYNDNRVRIVTNVTAPCSISGLKPTQLALTSSLNPSTYGEAVTFTATVAPYPGPTGTVGFTADGSTLSGCSAVTLSGGQAQCATSTLAIGSHLIVGVYSGDTSYQGSSGSLTQVVTEPVLTVTANNQTMVEGTTVPPLTYTMTGFLPGDNQGNSTTGQPTLSTTGTSSSPPGTYPIDISQGTLASAKYTFEFVNGTLTILSPGSFVVTATPNYQIVSGGDPAAYTVTVTSRDGFTGPVALTCAGAPPGGNCTFAESTLTLAADGSAQTTMTVTTTSQDAAAIVDSPGRFLSGFVSVRDFRGGEKGRASGGLQPLRDVHRPGDRDYKTSPGRLAPFSILSLCLGLCVAGIPLRRKRARRRTCALLLLLAIALPGLISCGCPNTQHQLYTLTVTGTSTVTPAITSSATVTLVVKP